jgi:hypothetical protein
VVAFYVNNITTGLLVTLDGRRLYAAQSWAMLAAWVWLPRSGSGWHAPTAAVEAVCIVSYPHCL